jgi:hypothetical protein
MKPSMRWVTYVVVFVVDRVALSGLSGPRPARPNTRCAHEDARMLSQPEPPDSNPMSRSSRLRLSADRRSAGAAGP